MTHVMSVAWDEQLNKGSGYVKPDSQPEKNGCGE